jgi:FkbM family methyltransferase
LKEQTREIFFIEGAGLWWPAYEPTGRSYEALKRRAPDYMAAVRRCGDFRTCVQAGGHVGLWPRNLAQYFKRVVTFEPDRACYEALLRNIEGATGIEAHNVALGTARGELPFRVHRNSGSASIDPRGDYVVPVTTIDALGLSDCGLICLDIEGSEQAALRGARETIAKFRPPIYVEQLEGYRAALDAFIVDLGYKLDARAGKDALYLPI